jgi:signal transduction histidine kinase
MRDIPRCSSDSPHEVRVVPHRSAQAPVQGLGIARRRPSPAATTMSPPSLQGASTGPAERTHRRLLRPFRRLCDDSILGGVCAGLAARMAVGTTVVRVTAVLSIFLGGLGILGYMAVWVFVPAAGEKDSIASRVMADRRELQIVLALSSALFAVLLVTRSLGVSDLGVPTFALLIGAMGALIVWRGASTAEAARLRERLNAAPGMAGAPSGWRRMAVRTVAGIFLILVGVGVLSRTGSFSGAALGVLMGTALFVGGFLVLFAPWWVRTLRDLSTERRERVRAQERADMAAHVHDSVLQTLSLIQKAAGDQREVVRLARSEERELRHWLFDPERLGRHGQRPETLVEAVAVIEQEVEDSCDVGVELIVVGDCPMDERVAALVGACHAATVNAAKWSGCAQVAVFIEVERTTVSAYVRDLGVGFEPALVPDDRHGIACSMVERMERVGGSVAVHSTLGAGTEVELVMPRSTST